MKHKPSNLPQETLPQWSYASHETSLATQDGIYNNDTNQPLRGCADPTPTAQSPTTIRSYRRYLTVGACVVLLLGLLGVLGGVLRVVAQDGHIPTTKTQWGQAVGRVLMSAGLPDLTSPLWGETYATQGEINTDSLPADTQETPTEQETEPVPQPLTVTTLDMSLWHLGVYHWQGDEGCVPPAYTDLSTLLTPEKSQVLLVCSHPYATYHTGGDVIDATGDSFAVDVPLGGGFPSNGVVDLGEALAGMLQSVGIDASMLACAEGDTHTQTYQTTAERVADYLEEHPQVGLVIDLCRSGELLPDGDVPRSMTTLGDVPTAQLQMVVSTGRGVGSMGDYTFAVSLRDWLFENNPTVCRPVYLRRGEGLTSSSEVVYLTMALGTAGNTYNEAYALLPYVAEGIVETIR